MAERLSADQVTMELSNLPAWSGGVDGLHRTVELATFPQAIAVVDEIARVAEELDHHPDIDIRWRKLTLRSVTHAKGGVTELDISLARRIDAIVEEATAE